MTAFPCPVSTSSVSSAGQLNVVGSRFTIGASCVARGLTSPYQTVRCLASFRHDRFAGIVPMKRIFGLDIPCTLEDVCDERRLALLVYDMQIGIVSQLKDGDAVIGRVRQVLAAARAAGEPVFFTRHMSPPNEPIGSSLYRLPMASHPLYDPHPTL